MRPKALHSSRAGDRLMIPLSSMSRRARVVSVSALLVMAMLCLCTPASAVAAEGGTHPGGGEASLRIPDLGQVQFLGLNGRSLLMGGLVVCVLGLIFGLVIFSQLRNLPVHESMRDISELIYE